MTRVPPAPEDPPSRDLASLAPAPAGAVGGAVRAALREHRAGLAGALCLVGLAGATGFALPLLVRAAVDAVLTGGGTGPVVWPVVGILGAGTLGAGTVAALGHLTAVIGERALHELRGRALSGALGLAPTRVRGLSRADLVTRLTSDVDTLAVAARQALPAMVRAGVLLVAGLAALAVLHPLLALAVAACALLATPFAVHCLRASGPVYRHRQEAEARAATVLAEAAEAGAVIAEARATSRWHDRVDDAAGEIVAADLAAMRVRNRLFPVLELLEAAGAAAVLGTGVLLVLDGSVTVGTLGGAVLAVATVFGPVGALLQWLDAVLQARAALTRVVALAGEPAEPVEPAEPRPLPPRGDLVVAGARFRYGLHGSRGDPRPAEPDLVDAEPDLVDAGSDVAAEPDVLRGVDLVVRCGERVALLGETGAGKSTLALLAVRAADPRSGQVSLGGVDLRHASTEELRRRVVLVHQEGYLPEGSLADAVRWARGEATDEEVAAALDAVGAGPWWRGLPHGLATRLGPDGTTVSSGQRQLVSLARVALVDPAVVVLDEATSRLDPATERRVDAALAAVSVGRAVLVIAHREQTAARADRLVVLDRGRVVTPSDER